MLSTRALALTTAVAAPVVFAGAYLGGVPKASAAVATESGARSIVSARSSTPVALANPQISQAVLDSLPSSILNRANLYISPDIRPGTAFVSTDRQVVPGQTKAQQGIARRALASNFKSCWQNAAVPLRTSVTLAARSCPAVIGSSKSARWLDAVYSNSSTNGHVGWKARGYKYTPVKKTCAKWSNPRPPLVNKCIKWKYTGGNKAYWVQSGGDHSVWVHWGEVSAYPTLRFTNSGIVGWMGGFH